jgi:hypothetical protein
MQTENHGLRIGDEIVHPTFGEGIIINIRGQGEKAEAAIRFRLVGEKHLSLAWAPLKKSGQSIRYGVTGFIVPRKSISNVVLFSTIGRTSVGAVNCSTVSVRPSQSVKV